MINRPLIAIDIGSSSVKIVELSGGRSKSLKALGLELLPPGAVVAGEIRDFDTVVDVVKELMNKLRIVPAGRRAAVAMGGQVVDVKKVPLQLDDDMDFDEQVVYEAEQYFQNDLVDLYFRYFPMTDEADINGMAPVLMVGATREVVERYVDLIHSVGLKVGVIDCDMLCLSNVFDYNYPPTESIVAVANVGATDTQLVLNYGGEYLFSQAIMIAGEEISRQIGQTLDLSYENAETLKVQAAHAGGGFPAEVQSIVDNLNEQVATEMRSAIDFFMSGSDPIASTSTLTHVFLTGGGSKLLGFGPAIAASMQVNVQQMNPFQRISMDKGKFDMDYILTQGHLYSVAVGLALREFGDHE